MRFALTQKIDEKHPNSIFTFRTSQLARDRTDYPLQN